MQFLAGNFVLIVLVVLFPLTSHAQSGTGAYNTALGQFALSDNTIGAPIRGLA